MMAIRHHGLQQRSDGDSGGWEDQQTALRCVRQRQLGKPGEVELQKLCSPCAIPLGTLLTVFLEQLCRTDARCS